ncbi:MAG: twin-arginine translocase TatA/TatE family subunit [Bacteroidota bacterium]
MFGNVGGWEILIIIFLIVIFFGAKKIPELAQGLGKGIKEFRKAAKDIQEDISLEEKSSSDKTK